MNARAQLPAVQDQPRPSQMFAPVGIFSAPDKFEHSQRVAKVFADSQLVPPHFKGKIADCLIALNIADRMQEDPLTVMQNLAIVSGKPCWQTQYMIARANKSGVFATRITWKSEGQGERLAVTAGATLADSGEVVSVAVSMAMAKADGWTKNAKYTTMPEHMLRWRSAAMLIRLYAPEVMLGIQSTEEVEDATPSAPRDVTLPRQIESHTSPGGSRPSGPPRLTTAKPAAAPEKSTPAEVKEVSRAVEDDAETVVAQFESDVQLARTEQDIADCEDALTPYAESDRLSRDQRNRVENATEAARARIKAPAGQESQQDDGEEAPVDPNDPDFKRGAEDRRRGQKRCVISAITADEKRMAAWKAGFDSVEAEG